LWRRTRSIVDRINRTFSTATWKPIILFDEEQEREALVELYRAADFCFINSLEDGMNLVAKEFVAARDDEDGILILSRHAGASLELRQATLVNPADIEGTAATIDASLKMTEPERRARMRCMRQTVKNNNVYHWAGRILSDASRAARFRSTVNDPRE
jgi:trehalose 6-phosphate synthase